MIESVTAARLGKLSYAQLQAAFDHFELGKVVEVAPVPFSNWGQNIFVTTTAGEFVLRGAPASPDQFPKEQYFIRQLAEGTAVPVPWPYLVNLSPDIFGWGYAIMPRLPGLQIGDDTVRQSLGRADRYAIAEALGETLAQMHGLEWPHAGDYAAATDTVAPFEVSYASHISNATRMLLRDFQRYVQEQGGPDGEITDGEITDADLEWADTLIAAAAPACNVPFKPTLVMGDYHERNVVAEAADGRWTVRGVFDFATAHVGDGEADLSRCFATYREQEPEWAEAFLAAYTRLRPPRDGFRERFALYMLDDRAKIWAFGHSQKMVWWDRRLSFRKWVESYLTP